MADQKHIDALSGTATTGHEWDGIHELNTPLPRWWLWLFYITIIWSVGYWFVYPAWPLISSYTAGAFDWHSRRAVVSELDALKAQRGPMVARLAAASLAEIAADPQRVSGVPHLAGGPLSSDVSLFWRRRQRGGLWRGDGELCRPTRGVPARGIF